MSQEIKSGDYVYIPSYSNKPLLVKNTETGVVIPFEVFVKERVSITFHENGKSSPHHIQPIAWLATPENKAKIETFYGCQLEDAPDDVKEFENLLLELCELCSQNKQSLSVKIGMKQVKLIEMFKEKGN